MRRMIEHVVREVNLILVLGKGISEGSSLARFAPLPVHKVVAYGGAKAADSNLRGECEGQRFSCGGALLMGRWFQFLMQA